MKIQKNIRDGVGGWGGRVRGVRVDLNREFKLLQHAKKNRGGVQFGGQGGCERRSEAIVKIQKKKSGMG